MHIQPTQYFCTRSYTNNASQKRLAVIYQRYGDTVRKRSFPTHLAVKSPMKSLLFSLLISPAFKAALGICYMKMGLSTIPRTIQTVVTADSVEMCCTACEDNPGCYQVVFTAATKTCVILNNTAVVPSGTCAIPYTAYGRFAQSFCPGPPNPEYLIVNDLCITQLFPELTVFGANRICPKRSCTDANFLVVRMVLKNGSFRTFDNEDGNSVIWNPGTEMFDFTYSVGGNVVLQLEVQSISCATPAGVSFDCLCETGLIAQRTAASYSAMTAASPFRDPPCTADYPILKTTNAKSAVETTDAPSDVVIRCMASKIIACRKSTFETWPVRYAACIQP